MENVLGTILILIVFLAIMLMAWRSYHSKPYSRPPSKKMLLKAWSQKMTPGRNTNVWPANNNGGLNDIGYKGE